MKLIKNEVSGMSLTLGLLMVLCLFPVSLEAVDLTEREVRAAVETWVRYVTADADPDAVIHRMEHYKIDGQMVAYVAHLAGGGFCLCGRNDIVLPVYLYSPQGTYDPENPNFQYVLWEIKARTKRLTQASTQKAPELQKYQAALMSRAFFWKELIAGRAPKRMAELEAAFVEPAKMELALTSQWGQDSPYNDRCPEFVTGQVPDTRVPVGCVATAMSQIMYYWQWPNTGVAEASVSYERRWTTNWISEPLANDPSIPTSWANRLRWTPAGGGRLEMNGRWDFSISDAARQISDDSAYRDALENLYLNLSNHQTTTHSANFGATTYNWSILQDTHTDPPDAADAEVAKLCYHTGIAIDMRYSIWGSGANPARVPTALATHFRYDGDGVYETRDINRMTDEINWLRPIEISGCEPGRGCHAWVVYGYNKGTDPARQFLMNMGWGMWSSRVWYSCDDLNLGFIRSQSHTTRLAPLNVVQFVGNDDSGDGSPGNPYKNIEEAIDPISGAIDGATLIFKAGSTNTFSASPLVINRPFTLRGYYVTIK